MISLLKYWKLIVLLIGVLGVSGIVYHYNSVIEENEDLKETVQVQEAQASSLEFQYENLKQSLAEYQQDVEKQRAKNDSLRNQLETIGDKNAKVQSCLDTELPSDFLNRLSE